MQTRLSPLFLCAFLLVGATAYAQVSADVAKRAADISKENPLPSNYLELR